MTKLRSAEQFNGSFEDGTNNKLDGLTQEVVSENLENLEHKVDHMTSETVTKESKIIRQELPSSPKKENQETAQQSSPSFPQRTSASKRNKTIPSPKREIPQAPAPQETSYPKEQSIEPHRLPRRTLPSIPPAPVRDVAEGVKPTIPTPPQSSRKKRTPTHPDQSTSSEQQPVKQEHYGQNTVPVSSPETKEKDDTWIEIEEKQTSSFGKYRGRVMGKEQAGFTREQITPQQAQQAEKNKQIIRTSTSKVTASLESALPPDELKLIETSIIQHVQEDVWYKEEVRKIQFTGLREGKSPQEIDKNIEAYNTEVKKQLLPVFIMEMQAGNIVLKRSGRILTLQEKTIKQLDANTEFTALKVVYEQFIRNPYLDLTNQNQLDWPQSTSTNRLENELIKSVATNSELETFLFDHPDRVGISVHTETQKGLMNNKNPDVYTHLKHLLGDTGNKEEEKTPTARNQLIQKLISRIEPYTQKRINQTIALNHCAVLNQCFGAYKSAGKSTIDEMHIDFDNLAIDSTSLTFAQPVTYQHLHTTLSLDGENGYLQLPNGLTQLFGGADDMRRIQSDTLPAKELYAILTQAAQLTPQELMKCASQKDIEQIITQKIEEKIQEITPQADKKRLNTILEQEALLANRKYFFSGEKITGENDQQIAFEKKEHATPLQQTLRRRIYGDGSQGPLGIEQLRTINNICIDPKMGNLFAQSTRNNTHGIETFLQEVGFFKRGPTMSNNDTVLFFTSLHKMATSGVPPQEESGYMTRTKLINIYSNGTNIPLGLSGTHAPYIYTTNHQIVPLSSLRSIV